MRPRTKLVLGVPRCAACTLQSSCSWPKSESIRGTSNPDKRVSQVPIQTSDFAELFKPYRGGGSHHPVMIRYEDILVQLYILLCEEMGGEDFNFSLP